MPAPNQRVGEYVLQDRVAAGTFGEVWRAHHHVWSDQVVAIKIPTDYQYLRNLQREGVAIHGLVHPNVVRAIGFDLDRWKVQSFRLDEFESGLILRVRKEGEGPDVQQVHPLSKEELRARIAQSLRRRGHRRPSMLTPNTAAS